MSEDPLAAFDGDLLAAVARERGRDPDSLRSLVAAMQTLVRDSAEVGGVDGLVYEWRRSFRVDPLVARTPETYYLAVEPRVWAEFGDRLDADEAALDAVRAVHARQFRADRDQAVDRDPLVLART